MEGRVALKLIERCAFGGHSRSASYLQLQSLQTWSAYGPRRAEEGPAELRQCHGVVDERGVVHEMNRKKKLMSGELQASRAPGSWCGPRAGAGSRVDCRTRVTSRTLRSVWRAWTPKSRLPSRCFSAVTPNKSQNQLNTIHQICCLASCTSYASLAHLPEILRLEAFSYLRVRSQPIHSPRKDQQSSREHFRCSLQYGGV